MELFYHFFTAHVIEEAREAKSGVEFLTTTRDDWKGSVFGCHITWHLTLYYFGKSDCVHVFFGSVPGFHLEILSKDGKITVP